MAMRLSGLMSGMDTESIVQELVAARQTKVDNAKKAQTKLSWKQDAWKELNTKLKNLQSKYLNNMRFESAYSKKTTKVSDTSVASVITGENAVNSVQELEVKKLAKTAYLTGSKITYGGSEDEELSALTKLSDLKVDNAQLSIADGSKINIKVGSENVDMDITAKTTISDVMNKLKEAGLNANFDAKQQRLFISAKESGSGNDFEITASDESILKALGLNTKTKDAFMEELKKNGKEPATAEEADELWKAEQQKYAKKIDGQDAEITLNGAIFTSNTNVFEINGLTITAQNTTEEGKPVTVTTQDDVDGIYDMVKDFLKEYNTIINEIDKLYNADSAKGYEPLTDEEKDAMSETEAEKYEQKIKDALLRRDSNLSSISSTLKQAMSSGFEVNGKTMYLSNFGIETLSYFEAPDNEKNAYHIAGDEDDADTSGKADVLKGMISSEPNTVISFFSQLSKNLYSEMDKLSKPVEGYRSFGSFYDDKKMKDDYTDYTSKIAELEEKLADYEDKWYAKFAEMETAMAKMQNNANAVTSLIGG